MADDMKKDMASIIIETMIERLADEGFNREDTEKLLEAATMILTVCRFTGAPVGAAHFPKCLRVASELLELRNMMSKAPSQVM